MKSLTELHEIRNEALNQSNLFRAQVLICGGTGCTSSGSKPIQAEFEKQLKLNGLDKEVKLVETGCFGLCALGPVVVVYPEGAFYSRVNVKDVSEIVTEHLLNGRVVKKLLYSETIEGDNIKSLNETAFYGKQKRVALRNCGAINPENIDDYIAIDGYQALGKVLTEMTREEVISHIALVCAQEALTAILNGYFTLFASVGNILQHFMELLSVKLQLWILCRTTYRKDCKESPTLAA